MKRIAIIGFGREGQSLYRYLKEGRTYKKAEFWVLDQNQNLKIPKDVKSVLGLNYLDNLGQFDLIFRSPGVPYHLIKSKCPAEGEARQRRQNPNAKISSATKIFFDRCPCPIIGITGTKGKTTTATLTYQIFKKCGWDVYLAGNVGKPALNILPKLKKDSLVVLEMSSFQLQDLTKSPQVAVVLEIFPDHQDAHLSFDEYFEAKSQIVRHQNSTDKVFYHFGNCNNSRLAKLSSGEKIGVDEKKFDPLAVGQLLMPGRHNARNALMAFSVAQSFGCPTDKILDTIFSFKGVEHRLEFVKTLRLARDGSVSFYNDSASTNPGTTMAAVKSFKEPKILIVGGKDKKLSYDEWPKVFSKNKVKFVVIYGENKNKIYKTLRPLTFTTVKVKGNIKIKKCKDLKECVLLAKKIALKLKGDVPAPQSSQSEVVVLFSPGAASFDMFRNYAERGEQFKKLVGLAT